MELARSRWDGHSCGARSKAEFKQAFGDAVMIVAEDIAFVDKVSGDRFDAKGADSVEVCFDGLLAFAGVSFEQRG